MRTGPVTLVLYLCADEKIISELSVYQDLTFNEFCNFYKCSFNLVSTHKKKILHFTSGHWARTHTLSKITQTDLHHTTLYIVQLWLKMLQYTKPRTVKSHLPHDHENMWWNTFHRKCLLKTHKLSVTGRDSLHFAKFICKNILCNTKHSRCTPSPWSLQCVMLVLLCTVIGSYNCTVSKIRRYDISVVFILI